MKPSVTDIDQISNISQPILRNLSITLCYHELSLAFSKRTGQNANWCTFAVWASKQAGQTIRREDLSRALEDKLKLEPEVEQALYLVATIAKKLGARQNLEQIRSCALASLLASVIDRASAAISLGNKKVFDEIARQFASFMATCIEDVTYNETHIHNFCSQLLPNVPPDGQVYLLRAFTRYYESFFIDDPKRVAELRLLANIEIGFHEQTRLQPEIQESLNAAAFIDPKDVKKRLLSILFPNQDHSGRFWLFVQQLFQRTVLLERAIETMVTRAQLHLRKLLTVHLMTLTLPPNNCLRLGQDLNVPYPSYLKELADTDLVALLKKIDPTKDSLVESGATDWANLPERLHYIADLFRCYFDTKDLFDDPFTQEQIMFIRAGQVPGGRL